MSLCSSCPVPGGSKTTLPCEWHPPSSDAVGERLHPPLGRVCRDHAHHGRRQALHRAAHRQPPSLRRRRAQVRAPTQPALASFPDRLRDLGMRPSQLIHQATGLVPTCVTTESVIHILFCLSRNRTKNVYTIFSRKPPFEIHSVLRGMGVDYVIVEESWCVKQYRPGCAFHEVWDEEDPANQNRPVFCQLLRHHTPPPSSKCF